MTNYQQQLIATGDFLALSLAHEHVLPAFSFSVEDLTGEPISVSVLDTGIITFEPQTLAQGYQIKQIVLSCGLHGNETAPIELLNDLIKRLLTGELILKHKLMVIFGNPSAIKQQTRFVNENLNSLFSCHFHQQAVVNFERKRAIILEAALTAFFNADLTQKHNFHYDLHTAIRGSKYQKFAICPYLDGKTCQAQQLAFLQACGIEAVLYADKPTNTFSYFSSAQFAAHSFTVELGQVKPFGQNNIAEFAAIRRQLIELLVSETMAIFDHNIALKQFAVTRSVIKQTSEFYFNFADDAVNFSYFPKGELLAIDGEKQYISEGEAIVFANKKVPIGQRALLLVRAMS